MISQSNVTHLLVGKDLNILANTATRADLATGQIGVFLVGSKTAKTDALVAGQRFTVVTKNSNGVLVESPVIEYNGITRKANVDYAAPTQRVRVIGFNGTTGAIDEQNNANYVAHIFWYDNSKVFGYGKPVKFAAYYSSASATQVEIAAGLTANFNKNAKAESPRILKAEVLINSAGVATSGGTASVVNGSKYMTIAESAGGAADAAKYNADAATLVAGDYIRLAGTGLADPCYKIVSITGGGTALATITLDTPYQGTTSATLAAASMEAITAALAAAADCGVKVTALATTGEFEPGLVHYDVTEFEIELHSDFGSTNLSSLANPFPGSGTYWEVAENEWFLKGNRGEAWRVGN
jgi:hypothetical protein